MRLVIALILAAGTAQANTCGDTTRVGPSETYYAISQRCGVSVDQIFAANPGVDHTDLTVGQTLALPSAANGPDLYAARFVGSYASGATCTGANLVLDLAPASVSFRNVQVFDGVAEVDEWQCPIQSVEHRRADAVKLTLARCWADYALLSWDGDEMTFEYAAAYTLRRCTDR